MTKLIKQILVKPDATLLYSSLVAPDTLEKSYSRILNTLDVSYQTRVDYQMRGNEFYLFLQTRGLHDDTLLEYKRMLEADNTIKTATKNKKLTVARLVLREMYRSGKLPRDLTTGVKNFKQSGLHKTTGLDEADIKQIRTWIHTERKVTPAHLRTFSILMLLAYHGLRQIEICRLSYEDINFDGGYALVQGKGRDDTEKVHLHRAVVAMLRSYCEEYGISGGPLFFSISNSSYGRPLTTRGLRELVTRVLDMLCIDKTVHGFRHYYVTRLVEAYRGDLFRVMQFTRHKSLSMLEIYNDESLHEAQYPVHDRIFENVL